MHQSLLLAILSSVPEGHSIDHQEVKLWIFLKSKEGFTCFHTRNCTIMAYDATPGSGLSLSLAHCVKPAVHIDQTQWFCKVC